MILYTIQGEGEMKRFGYPKEKAAPMASPSAKLWKASPSTTWELDLASGLPLPCCLLIMISISSHHTCRRGYGGFLGNVLHLYFLLMSVSLNLLPFTWSVSEVATLGQCEVYLGGGSPTLERVKVVFSAITPPSSIAGR